MCDFFSAVVTSGHKVIAYFGVDSHEDIIEIAQGVNMIYYAHSRKTYNTQEEMKTLQILKKVFKNVLCPNHDLGELGDIKHYLRAIDKCSAVVATLYQGYIGKGVYEELTYASKHNKDCFIYVNDMFVLPLRIVLVDQNDWAVRYAKIIFKGEDYVV